MKCEWIAETKFVKEEEMVEAEASPLAYLNFCMGYSWKSAWTTEWNSWLWKWEDVSAGHALRVFHWLVTGLIDLQLCAVTAPSEEWLGGKPQEPLVEEEGRPLSGDKQPEAGLLYLTFNAFQFTSSHNLIDTGWLLMFGFRLSSRPIIGHSVLFPYP